MPYKSGGAGAFAQCHLNRLLWILLTRRKGMPAMPHSPRSCPAFSSFGVNALSGSIEQTRDLGLVDIAVGSGLQPVPGSVHYVPHESETELPRGKIMPSRRQSHDRTHEVVGRHSRE